MHGQESEIGFPIFALSYSATSQVNSKRHCMSLIHHRKTHAFIVADSYTGLESIPWSEKFVHDNFLTKTKYWSLHTFVCLHRSGGSITFLPLFLPLSVCTDVRTYVRPLVVFRSLTLICFN